MRGSITFNCHEGIICRAESHASVSIHAASPHCTRLHVDAITERHDCVLLDYSPLSSAIMFESAEAAKWEYTIRFNQSIEVPSTVASAQMDLAARAFASPMQQYFASGFMSIQQSVQAFARKTAPGGNIPTVKVALNFPTAGYKQSIFWSQITFVYGLVMCISLVSSVAFVAKEIVLEKEQRIREAMFIMSLSRTSYYLSWLVTFMSSHAVTALLMALASLVSLFQNSHFLVVLIYFYLFLLSSFSFSFFLTSFFSRARVAQIVALIFWLGTSFIVLATQLSAMPPHVLRGLSLFPVVAFANAGDVFAELEGNDIGIDFNAMFYSSKQGTGCGSDFAARTNTFFFVISLQVGRCSIRLHF